MKTVTGASAPPARDDAGASVLHDAGASHPALDDLERRYLALRDGDPPMRARDLAERLGVAEGALVAIKRMLGEAVRLCPRGPDLGRLVEALPDLGRVMTLTRNNAAVHEVTGRAEAAVCEAGMGQVTGPIDLRLFFRHWHVAFDVAERTRSGLRRSLQVFDATGTAVLKIYAVPGTDMTAWDALVARHRDRSEAITAFMPASPPAPDRADAEIDVDALREGWRALDHSHDFFALLRAQRVGRLQALRLAGEDLACRIDPGSVETLLRGAAMTGVPIMVFVGNPGCLQIFSGEVHEIDVRGPWLNVLDPGFNLHLRADRVASAWRVVKPTRLRGPITSVELFDEAGTLIARMFGARPPGEPERPAWAALVDEAAVPARAL